MNRLDVIITTLATLLGVAVLVGMSGVAFGQYYGGSAPPNIKWDSTTNCTTITLKDGTPEVVICKGADGTGGSIRIPNCPTNLNIMSANSLCGAAGGRGIVVKGSTAAYTLVP